MVLVFQQRQVRSDLLQTSCSALAFDLLDLLPHRNELRERPSLGRVGVPLEYQSTKRIRDAADLAAIAVFRNNVDPGYGADELLLLMFRVQPGNIG